MKNKRILSIAGVVATLLLIPFTAMQFTTEVNWSLFDFVIAGVLLLGTGLLIELAIRVIKNKDYRIGVIAIIVIALLLIWVEMAVGIFGSPIAGS